MAPKKLEPLSAKDADYWSKMTPGEMIDTWKYLDEAVQKGDMSADARDQIKNQISDARARNQSVQIARNPKDQAEAYTVLAQIDYLNDVKTNLEKENPTLAKNDIDKINTEIDKLEKQLEDIATREQVAEKTKPKTKDPLLGLIKEQEDLLNEREDLKYKKEDLSDIKQRIADKEAEIEETSKELDRPGTWKNTKTGRQFIETEKEAKGEYKGPDQSLIKN